MNRISIAFLHPAIKTIDDVRRYIKFDERSIGAEFCLVDDNPDYVIASECIYYDMNLLKRFRELYKLNPITVFFAGEAIAGDLNLFDYIISFDKHWECDDRIGRIPLLTFFGLEDEFLINRSEIKGESKRQFCNFIYSNSNAHPRRDELFYLISKYKSVDSLGRHLNNKSCEVDRFAADWRKGSIDIKSNYRFSISAENAEYRGYTSEKIMTSFLAGSIPIYWGNPLVEEEFNPKAFINANKYNDKELLEIVESVDTCDEIYHEMVNQPWMTDEQLVRFHKDKEKYERFIAGIFVQSKYQAYRKGSGTAPGIYNEFILGKSEPERISRKMLIKMFLKGQKCE